MYLIEKANLAQYCLIDYQVARLRVKWVNLMFKGQNILCSQN